MRLRNLIFAVAALALLLLPLGNSGAQIAGSPVRRGEEAAAPVYFETAEREALASAGTFFAKGRAAGWNEAIRKIQGLVEQYGDKLVLVDENEGRYLNFAALVFEGVLADEAALKEYRRQFDGYAARLLKQARETGEAAPLVKIMRNYLPSSHTGEAFMLLAERAREMGDFATADWFFRKIERLGGASNVPREILLARRANALAGLGDARALEALAAGPSDETAQKEILALGRKQTLREYIEAALKEAKSPSAVRRAEGNDSPDGAPAKSVPVETLLFSAELGAQSDLFEAQNPGAPKSSLEQFWMKEFNQPRYRIDSIVLPYRPLITGDGICVSHNNILETFGANGAFKWERHNEGEKITMMSSPFGAISNINFPYAEQRYATAWRGRVFGVANSKYEIEKKMISPAPFGNAIYAVRKMKVRTIVCLDASNGKPNWATGEEREDEPLREVDFCTPPAFSGGRGYAVGVAGADMTKKDFALYCFDLYSGRMLWKSSLFQTASSPAQMNYSMPADNTAQLPLADGGDLYVTTNEGATMCVSALDGRIEWLVKYVVSQCTFMPFSPAPQMYWYEIRPQLAEGVLLAAAGDCRHLNAHDPATGEILWKWDNADMLCRYVLGANEGKLYLAGDYIVPLGLKSGKLLAFPQAFHVPSLIGRPCMSDGHIYAPARGGILTYDLKSLKLASIFSFKTMSPVANVEELAFGKEEYTGNLAICDGMLVALNPGRISAFGRK